MSVAIIIARHENFYINIITKFADTYNIKDECGFETGRSGVMNVTRMSLIMPIVRPNKSERSENKEKQNKKSQNKESKKSLEYHKHS